MGSNGLSLLEQYIRATVAESRARYKNKLFVFDFDDTLVRTDSKVLVTNVITGRAFELTPAEFAGYIRETGDEYDFSQFDNHVLNPKMISWTNNILRNAYKKHGPSHVAILTARGRGQPVRDYLDSIGIHGIKIAAINSNDPQDKARWLSRMIDRHDFDYVEFFDDNRGNVVAAQKLDAQHPDVRVVVRHVTG